MQYELSRVAISLSGLVRKNKFYCRKLLKELLMTEVDTPPVFPGLHFKHAYHLDRGHLILL